MSLNCEGLSTILETESKSGKVKVEYVNVKEVKVIDVKVAEMNEVKSDEMVPDWLWGGEKLLRVISIIIVIMVVIIMAIIMHDHETHLEHCSPLASSILEAICNGASPILPPLM